MGSHKEAAGDCDGLPMCTGQQHRRTHLGCQRPKDLWAALVALQELVQSAEKRGSQWHVRRWQWVKGNTPAAQNRWMGLSVPVAAAAIPLGASSSWVVWAAEGAWAQRGIPSAGRAIAAKMAGELAGGLAAQQALAAGAATRAAIPRGLGQSGACRQQAAHPFAFWRLQSQIQL